MKAYMALSCKVGTYNKVLDKLLEMNLTKRDIFCLFGPLDILVQFRDLKNLNEFIQKWFNPVRMITAEESLIEKTLTLIVISEGPSYVEEPFAFIFLNTQSVHLERVKEKLLTLPPVLSADTVFGPYDVICAVRSRDSDKLARFLFQIQREIPGITGTMTAFVTSLY